MRYSKTKIIRHSPEQNKEWAKAAKKIRKSISDFIREAADLRAEMLNQK